MADEIRMEKSRHQLCRQADVELLGWQSNILICAVKASVISPTAHDIEDDSSALAVCNTAVGFVISKALVYRNS